MVQRNGVWHEGGEVDTGERHYCARVTAFDPDIQFQRQLIAELHLRYEQNVDYLYPIPSALRHSAAHAFINRWEFFDQHALLLWVSKEKRIS